jgi:two-component system response regulator MprA
VARILVVDDVPGLRAVTATLLRCAGHEADTASGGYQALEKVQKRKPDLVLLDLTMPDMDGFEVLERLDPDGLGRPEVPVVILSSLDDADSRSRARELGASGYVLKGGDDFDMLLAEVSRHE